MKSHTALLALFTLVSTLAMAHAGQEPAKSNSPPTLAPPLPVLPRKPLFPVEESRTFTSLDAPTDAESSLPPRVLKFTDADLAAVLEIYQELCNRTVLRPASLPNIKISLTSQTRLTRREALQTLDSLLALNGITMIPMGTRHVKAVPASQAAMEAAPLVELPSELLPESGTYITYVIRLKHLEPAEAAQALQPFSKMPNSIVAIPDSGALVVRDYAVNVRRMIHVLNQVESAREKLSQLTK